MLPVSPSHPHAPCQPAPFLLTASHREEQPGAGRQAMCSGPSPEPAVTSAGSSLARKGSNCHSENRRVQLSASASVRP